MIKRLLMFVCVVIMAVSASAQITWNAKGGVGIARCTGLNDEGTTKDHIVGKIGVGIEKPLSSNWSIMPSFEVAWKGAKWEIEEDGDYTGKETLNLFYLQIPVVAAYRLRLADAWNMTLKAGPYFAYDVYNKADYKYSYNGTTYEDDEDDLDINKFDLGLDAGVDFEYHRFVFGAELEWGFLNMVKDQEDDEDFSVKNLAFYVTVGWKF